jgi:glycosyltransferase involved in cell wall biosynthesis
MNSAKLPTVSCIIPTFNCAHYVGEAIDSVLAQSYRPTEIIVVDDGSTDGTADVVAAYEKHVRYLRQTNTGPASARNYGLRVASGDFMALLDADDIWHPEKLDRQMSCFRDRPELDICVAHVQNFWIPELTEEAKRFQNHRIAKPLPGYCTGTLVARKVRFDSVGHFDNGLKHGDVQDWFMRAAEQGAVMQLLPDVLLYRRLHHSNISRAVSVAFDDHLRIIKGSLDRRRQRDGTVKDYDFAGGAENKSGRSVKSS